MYVSTLDDWIMDKKREEGRYKGELERIKSSTAEKDAMIA